MIDTQTVLRQHHIATMRVNGRLLAQNLYTFGPGAPCTEEWLDVTEWPLHLLYEWLGY